MTSNVSFPKIILWVAVFILMMYFFWMGVLGDYVREVFPNSLVVRKLSADGGDWGSFGDFLGGVLNPIIAGLTLWKVMDSSKEQSEFLNGASKSIAASAVSQAEISRLQKENLELQKNLVEANERLVRISAIDFISKSSFSGLDSKLSFYHEIAARYTNADTSERIRIEEMLGGLEEPINKMKEQIKVFESMVQEMLSEEAKK